MAQVMFFLVSSLLFFRQITLLRMAAKALKDLKNLPVSERNIDCKKNPCAGKMNGKAEDRPPQNSVPLDHNHPTGDEIEKPEAERVIVELEYIKSKDLNNVAEVDAVLKVSIVLSWYYTMLYCDFSFVMLPCKFAIIFICLEFGHWK